MKKRIFSVALAICLVLSLMPMSVFADSAEVIRIDVGGANVDNENYLIDDSQIILRKRDVTYELTGTTDKNISSMGQQRRCGHRPSVLHSCERRDGERRYPCTEQPGKNGTGACGRKYD
jgi:hypothetical protein